MISQIRDSIIGFLYRKVLKPVLFLPDVEKVHDWFIGVGRFLGSSIFTKKLTGGFFGYQNKMLEQTIAGINFKNPVGLAAGFDKDGLITDILPYVGFGFEEVGSITGEPFEGNPKPRLWRLKKSKSYVVYYGLKNAGCETIAQKLSKKHFEYPLGTSIAKTNSRATAEVRAGIADYAKAYGKFTDIGDYYTINISCPNTWEEEEPFTKSENLDALLTELEKILSVKPVFIKLSPDLPPEKIDGILSVADKHRVAGFVCGNLTKKRANPKIIDGNIPTKGGMSGKVVEELADNLIRRVYRLSKGKYIIIGCGGVFSADDAYKKIRLGASLIQLITGMIYEGPQLIGEINRGLAKLLKKDGYKNISEAVGVDAAT